MRFTPHGLVAALLILSAASTARAGFQKFTTADGLVADAVRSILQDTKGHLWFGTYLGGISRFDGVTWTTFDSTGGNLPGQNVFDMLEDRTGRIWVATNLGLARFDGNGWQRFDPFVGPKLVGQIEEDGGGDVWVRRSGLGVGRYDGQQWTPFTTADGLANDDVTQIYVDRSGLPWFTTAGGVSRFDGTAWTTYTMGDGLASNQVSSMLEDMAGNFWFATSGGLSRFDGASWTTFGLGDGLAATQVVVLFEDSGGRLWAGTTAGVSVFDSGSWQTFTIGEGLADNDVQWIAEDARGFVWFGSSTSLAGISRYDRAGFEPFTTQDGLAANNASGFLRDRDGNLWIASATTGVTRFDGVTFRRFGILNGMTSNAVRAAIVDSADVLWLGTPAGVNRHDGRTWQAYTTAHGLPANNVTSLLEDDAGVIWAGTSSGAATFTGTSWSPVAVPTGSVNAVFQDDMSNVWLGTSTQGAFRYDGLSWTQFSSGSGNTIINNNVLSISQDSTGALWFGTIAGASRFDGAAWLNFTTANGLPAPGVNAIVVKSDGTLWFCTLEGVARYDGSSVTTFAESDGLANRGVFTGIEDEGGILWFGTVTGVSRFDGERFVNFGEGDGLSGPRVRAIAHDQKDRYWFGTENGATGLTRFEPDRVPPRAVIVPQPPALSANRLITLTYIPAYGEARGIEFSVSFDGNPRAWSFVSFFQRAGVEDGVHVFEVRARDEFGNLQAIPSSVTFEIDGTQPAPVITSPRSNDAVRGAVSVEGTTDDSRFLAASVLVRPAGASSWSQPPAIALGQSAVPVTDSTLAVWNTVGWPEGDYELTVFVADTLGLLGSPGPLKVTVDNLFPFVNQTSPARIVATQGGNVYTTNQEVKVFFPPNAFDRDATVTIEMVPGTALPDSLGTGVRRLLPGFDLRWAGARLEKPGTIEVDYGTASVPAGATLALYMAVDSTWRRVGGTPSPPHIGTTFDRAGRFALFSETVPVSGGGALSSITLAPRAFSPRGHFSSNRIAIGFALGRAAPVTVKIYNRAGRHVRTVADGLSLGAGQNLVYWDGRDRNGDLADEGLYLVSVEALGETQTRTLAVVK